MHMHMHKPMHMPMPMPMHNMHMHMRMRMHAYLLHLPPTTMHELGLRVYVRTHGARAVLCLHARVHVQESDFELEAQLVPMEFKLPPK